MEYCSIGFTALLFSISPKGKAAGSKSKTIGEKAEMR